MIVDVFDTDWEALSCGELLVLQDLLKGELKRRRFPDSGRASVSPDKQIVQISLEMRIGSQQLRRLARELRPAKAGKSIAENPGLQFPDETPDDKS
jgi:hypothetical protein